MSDPTSQEPSKVDDILGKYIEDDKCTAVMAINDLHAHAKTLESETASLRAQLAEAKGMQEKQIKFVPPSPNCELCKGSGFYGDNGPGRRGNNESHECECTSPSSSWENMTE